MYQKTTLENGIQVMTEKIPTVRSVSIGIMVDAGPQHEQPTQRGVAHLVEHLLFQGTSSRDALDIARLMDSAGGSIGAFTTRDYTCYYASVLDDYYPYALDLLGDILLNSIFPEESINSEKSAILHEIEASFDNPNERVHTLLKCTAWPDHPLGRPVAGKAETVRNLTREDAIYFLHEHYLPNKLTIAAAGNLNHEDFVAQVRDAFWRMLGEGPCPTPTPVQHHAAVAIEHVPFSQTYFALGIPAPAYTDAGRYAMHVLNTVLGGGISSRLFSRLREERGLVYQIGSEYHAYRDAGMWVVEGSTAAEYLMPVLALTLMTWWQLVTGEEPIDDEELWKTQMQLRGQHLITSEDSYTRMSRLATQAFYFGEHISSAEILRQMANINRTTLQTLANEHLIAALEQVTVAVVGPEAPEQYSHATIEGLLTDLR